MPDDAGGSGPRRWHDDLEPGLRGRVLDKILEKLVKLYAGKPGPAHDLNRIATSFEQKIFSQANSKDEYIKRIACKMIMMERNRQPVLQGDSSGRNQMQPPVDRNQRIHGGNSSNTITPPQASPTMSSHERQSPHMRNLPITPSGSSTVPKQHMSNPVSPNTHIKNRQADAVTMSNQLILRSLAATVTPSSGVHPSQLTMQQPVEGQNQNKLPVMQMQPINFSCGNAASETQSQGQSIVQPNGGQQQNPLRQNTRGTNMLPQQQQLRMSHQGLEVNPQNMNRQNSQMLVAQQQANVSNMQIGRPRERDKQPNVGLNASPLQTDKHITMEPQPLITVNRQSSSHSAIPQITVNQPSSSHSAVPQITVNQPSSSHSAIPQTVAPTGSAEEADWRAEMFEQMMVLRDAYLSELVELDEISVVPKITKEEFESLPKEKADQYRFRVYMKKRIRTMLKFLQFEKSTIPEELKGQLPKFVKSIQNVLVFYRQKKDQRAEMDTGCQPQISDKTPQTVKRTGDPGPSSGATSSQQKQPVQPVAFYLGQNTATRTPSASGGNHSNILLGVASSCVPSRSPGSVPPLPSNMLKDYYTPSPVTKESLLKISSLSTSSKSIWSSPVIGASPSMSPPIYKPDFKVASPPALVKSTLPLVRPVPMFGSQARSTSPSPFAMGGIAEIATPSASSVSPLQSPTQNAGVAQAASPCPPVKSGLSPLGANSGVIPVASPRGSMTSTSSENLGTVSALMQQNNAAAASHCCTTNLLMPSSLLQAGTADFQAGYQQHGGGETPVAKKKPMDRLIAAVRSLSPAALKSSADSIRSVTDMDDRAPHGEFNPFQQWSFFSKQGGSSQPPKKVKRSFEIPASDYYSESSPLFDTWEVEANAEQDAKRQNTQNVRDDVLYEIESANSMLIDTVISIADDNKTDRTTATSGETLIKLSYTAVSLALDLKALFATSETPIIMPAKLLVPADYPRSSPVLVTDQRGEQLRNMFSDISGTADVAFRNTLDGMPEPRSIRETVRAWDACVRRAVAEFAQRFGGGMFSLAYGGWESCTGAWGTEAAASACMHSPCSVWSMFGGSPRIGRKRS